MSRAIEFQATQETIRQGVIKATKERILKLNMEIIDVQRNLTVLMDERTSDLNFLINIYENGVDAINGSQKTPDTTKEE